MPTKSKLQVTAHGEREIRVVREFAAPRTFVWDALTRPELVQRWLHGPDDWRMVRCEIDLRVGGAYRYEWRNGKGTEMAMGGVYRELQAPERIVCTELFDQDWTGGEAVGTTVLTERDGRTTLTNVIRYASPEARDAVLQTPMEEGMGIGYDRLEALVVDAAAVAAR